MDPGLVALARPTGSNGDMLKLIAKFSVPVVLLLSAFALPASGALASGPQSADRGAEDTTPPDAYIRARKRQDLDYVFRKGIQATCGTADDEQPLTCRMTATRKGRVLATDTGSFDRPYNRYHFNLRLGGADMDRIEDVGHPVDVKLHLRATDEAGNSARVTKRLVIVKDLWGS